MRFGWHWLCDVRPPYMLGKLLWELGEWDVGGLPLSWLMKNNDNHLVPCNVLV